MAAAYSPLSTDRKSNTSTKLSSPIFTSGDFKVEGEAETLEVLHLEYVPQLALEIRKSREPQSSHIGDVTCEVGPVLRGSFNLAFKLLFSDGIHWLLRVPMGAQDLWDEPRIRHLRSTALTMALIHRTTSIPVPEIYGFEATFDNQLRYPYTIMEFLDGRPLYEVWDDPTATAASRVEHRTQAVHDIAAAVSQFDRFTFDKIGAPIFDAVGDIVDIGPIWTVAEQEVGPFDNTYSYLSQYIENTFDDTDDYELWLRQFIQWACSADDSKEFTLYHADLDWQNIIVDDSGHLRGIIDFDFVHTMPRCVGKYSYPSFLDLDWRVPLNTDDRRAGLMHEPIDGHKRSASAQAREECDFTRAVWRTCIDHYAAIEAGESREQLDVGVLLHILPLNYSEGLEKGESLSVLHLKQAYDPEHLSMTVDHVLEKIVEMENCCPGALGPSHWKYFSGAGATPDVFRDEGATCEAVCAKPASYEPNQALTISMESSTVQQPSQSAQGGTQSSCVHEGRLPNAPILIYDFKEDNLTAEVMALTKAWFMYLLYFPSKPETYPGAPSFHFVPKYVPDDPQTSDETTSTILVESSSSLGEDLVVNRTANLELDSCEVQEDDASASLIQPDTLLVPPATSPSTGNVAASAPKQAGENREGGDQTLSAPCTSATYNMEKHGAPVIERRFELPTKQHAFDLDIDFGYFEVPALFDFTSDHVGAVEEMKDSEQPSKSVEGSVITETGTSYNDMTVLPTDETLVENWIVETEPSSKAFHGFDSLWSELIHTNKRLSGTSCAERGAQTSTANAKVSRIDASAIFSHQNNGASSCSPAVQHSHGPKAEMATGMAASSTVDVKTPKKNCLLDKIKKFGRLLRGRKTNQLT